jgi:hypothetical protein
MSDKPLVAAERFELEACEPKNRAEECVLEEISNAIKPPPGGALPNSGALDRLNEDLPLESLVTPESIRSAEIWITLRSTLRCLGVELISGRWKTIALCVINATYSGDEIQELRDDETVLRVI